MPHEQRLRDYLIRDEVTLLLRAAKKSPRHATRNYAMILIAYRHGLRASEVVNLRLSDLDLHAGTILLPAGQGLALESASLEAGRGPRSRKVACTQKA